MIKFKNFVKIGMYIQIAILFLISMIVFNLENGLADFRFIIFSNISSSEFEFFQMIDNKKYYVPSNDELDHSAKLNKKINNSGMKMGSSELDYSIDVINSFSRFGGREGFKCGLSKNFSEAIDQSLKGIGCCADHVSIYRALVAGSGLKVRETHNQKHTFSEFYSSSQKKWIFIDPMFKVIALQNNIPLSLNEMLRIVSTGGVLNMKSFGDGFEEEKRARLVSDYYGAPERFNFLAYTENNNPFDKNLSRKFESTYMRIAYQFYQFIINPNSGYITFYKSKYKVMTMNSLKYLFWSSFISFFLFLFLFLFLFFRKYFIFSRP